MIWHLIAAVFAALAAAGIGLALRHLSGRRLPRWIVPVFAGLGMLSYQIHVEYSWFEHKKAQLPASAVVIDSAAPGNFWRPWTYLIPMTSKFSVVEPEGVHRQDAVAEFLLYHFERHHTDVVTTQPYLLNCASRELVPVDTDTREPMGRLRTLRATSTLLTTVCGTAS